MRKIAERSEAPRRPPLLRLLGLLPHQTNRTFAGLPWPLASLTRSQSDIAWLQILSLRIPVRRTFFRQAPRAERFGFGSYRLAWPAETGDGD